MLTTFEYNTSIRQKHKKKRFIMLCIEIVRIFQSKMFAFLFGIFKFFANARKKVYISSKPQAGHRKKATKSTQLIQSTFFKSHPSPHTQQKEFEEGKKTSTMEENKNQTQYAREL